MKRKSLFSLILTLAIVIAAVCMLQVSALAAEVTVTTAADLKSELLSADDDVIVLGNDIDIGDDWGVTVGAGSQTLRGDGHTITIDRSCNMFELWGNLTVENVVLAFNISDQYNRFFSVNGAFALTLDGCDLSGAKTSAIYNPNAGAITIRNSNISDNSGATGGAIFSAGAVNVFDSTFRNNVSTGDGGAISTQNGAIYCENSTFEGNTAGGNGGAFFSWTSINLVGCTVANNTSSQNGGAIYTNWKVDITGGSVVTHNTAAWHGGVVYCENGTVYLKDSDLTYNVAVPANWGHGAIVYTGAGGAVDTDILVDNCYIFANSNAFNDNFYMAQPGRSLVLYNCYYVKEIQEEEGTKITVTVIPAEGYVMDYIKIYDEAGNTYIPTFKGGNEYEVIIPNYEEVDVRVDVNYRPIRGCLVETFRDVKDSDRYHEAIDYVVEKNVMTGVGNNEFAPDTYTTRGMVITILYRMCGSPAVNAANPFADVPADEWYTDAILWGVQTGLVNGYDNGNFGPEDLITREQLAAIMYRFASGRGYDVNKKASLIGFANEEKTGEYAKDAIVWAVGIKAYEGSARIPVDLIGNVPRAELANAIMACATTYGFLGD